MRRVLEKNNWPDSEEGTNKIDSYVKIAEGLKSHEALDYEKHLRQRQISKILGMILL